MGPTSPGFESSATMSSLSLSEPRRPLTLLWVNVRLLHPLIGGDRIRTYQMLRRLKAFCRIHYVCPVTKEDDPGALAKASEYCDELSTFPLRLPRSGSPTFYLRALWNALVGKRPFSCGKYASQEAARLLQERLCAQRPDCVVADYLMSFVHFDGWKAPGQPPLIVFQHNLESLIWQRHLEAAGNPLKRFVFARERDLTRKLEERVAAVADGQIAVSEEEFAAFKTGRGMGNVLGWVPTGVDCDYFQPVTGADAATLAFLGSMDWHANVEAIQHFVRHSYPAIRRARPDARLLLIGRNPPPALRALAAMDASIEVTGTVDDVRPFLARAAIMILPLRVGGGTRIKVFEGMAAGLALVSTRIGVEGLPVRDGEHALLADDPVDFANAVLALMNDDALRARLAKTARGWVEAHFSWEHAARRFLELCAKVAPALALNSDRQA